MSDFLSLFHLGFMQRALVAGLLLGPLAGLLGSFVVLRGLSFFGEAIGHSTIAGIAIAMVLGLDIADSSGAFLATLTALSLVAALAIHTLEQRGALRADTSIAIVYATMVALGTALIARVAATRAASTMVEVLLGSILFVRGVDIAAIVLLLLLVGVFFWRSLSPLALLTLQPEYAEAIGIPTRRLSLLFLVLLTMMVATSVRIMGAMLVTALLVIPAAAARNVAGSLRQMLLLACITAVISIEGGIVTSAAASLPAGACIVLVAVFFFGASMATKWLRPAAP